MKVKSEYPVITLGKLAEKIDYGFSASATDVGDGPKFLRITDIQDDHVNWSTVPLCEADKQDTIKYALAEGDIVFARTGATTGKSYLIRHCPQNSIFASYLIRVRPSKDVDSGYLSRFFQTSSYWRQINLNTSGTAQGGVNATKLKTLLVPLPPLEEQRKIAAILDKADGVRRKRKEAIRLTEELLKSTFLEMFGDPVTNPKGWRKISLGELLAEPLQNGAYFPKERYVEAPDGVEMVHMSDAFYNFVERGNLKRVQVTSEEFEKYKLIPNDVLIARRSLNYEGSAKPCLISETAQPLIFESSLIRVRLNAEVIDSFFFFSYMLEPRARSAYVFPNVTKSTISGINQAGLKRISVLAPPMSIQKKYRDIYETILGTQSNYQKDYENIDNLFNSLLQRAFRGEL
jgi:type I restriction enzyme S subunit